VRCVNRRVLSNDHVLRPVDELASDVQVTRVARGLGDDVERHLIEIRKPPGSPTLWPRRRLIIWSVTGNDVIGQGALFAVARDGREAGPRSDVPRVLRIAVALNGLAGEYDAKPVTLDVEGQMLNQTRRRPTAWRKRPRQLRFTEAVDRSEDMAALIFKCANQEAEIIHATSWHTASPLRCDGAA
jgi:hypothetical protein